MKHVIVGTAGHIDHGKSSLVAALTGTHPDRLEEEKRRGITIDLGFAFLDLDEVRIGFVDVPGHERFVRNMLAGAGGIDLVLLVVAADESVKPQTREHFDICRLLGISAGIIALTKSDLADADMLGLAKLETEDLVRGSFLEGAPMIEVSAKTGAGLDALREALRRSAEALPGKNERGHFRLPVDRAFVMKGFGPVVTGTLISGSVRREDEVELFPARRRARVRGLHSGGAAVERAVAGQRTAINLAGVELDELGRGITLASPGIFQPTRRLDARIELLRSSPPLKNRSGVHFHHGTSEMIAEVILLDSETLASGGEAFAQLRLTKPVLTLPHDRFILRRFSPVTTIGGGTVLDPLARAHRQKDTGVIPLLGTVERDEREAIVEALAAGELHGLSLPSLVARTGWLDDDARKTIGKLTAAKKLAVAQAEPLVVLPAAAVAECAKSIRAALEQFNRANPLVPGIAKEDLRRRTKSKPEVFRAALRELAAARAVNVEGDLVQSAGREIALLPEEARAKEVIEQEFDRAGLAVPRFEDVLAKLPVEAKRAQKIFQLLLREKTLVKIAEDLVFHKNAVARLRQLIAKYKKERGEHLPIGAFKEMTGVTRKYAIPLLEFLDREGVTRRAGDERVIL
ncbi:MAG TPA: selenocysteine-specific translation elongation factor [Candidatus Acidoferrales bacterium]|nr:selenocysteine-specific translation elongation factor [Candidatus Acidoferrales bacterium]